MFITIAGMKCIDIPCDVNRSEQVGMMVMI